MGTTPMMLHALAYIGNMSDNIWHYLFFNDILMIISGLIGSTVGGGDKWVFFGFSILCYLPVIHYLCERKNRAIDNRIQPQRIPPPRLVPRRLQQHHAPHRRRVDLVPRRLDPR